MSSSFINLGISNQIVGRLEKNGIIEPTLVQEKVIPMVHAGKNVMFQSETGSGKTLAYLLPLIDRLENDAQDAKDISLLVVSPTYELAAQIKAQIQAVSDLSCTLCIGGSPISKQIDKLREHPRIVIGGSARILELIHLKKLKADNVRHLVLDEADRLLSPELRDETQTLLDRLNKDVQIIGNSATVSEYTKNILQKVRGEQGNSEPMEFVSVDSHEVLRNKIEHWAIYAQRQQKIDTLRSFIHAVQPEKLIVFTNRTDQVENIVSKLKYKKIECEGFSSKTDKKLRKIFLDRFRSGKLPILVTTDLASRGLDIPKITHVVQMDLSDKADFFIHRAGRTARAGGSGINCVIGDEKEMFLYSKMEKKLGITVYPKELYKGRVVAPSEFTEEEDGEGHVS
ncbi:MAG: DEAD/DEAH box helicase [Treponema sp.]|nr:DEAD/DEAH box helicase [Treponema sp.]